MRRAVRAAAAARDASTRKTNTRRTVVPTRTFFERGLGAQQQKKQLMKSTPSRHAVPTAVMMNDAEPSAQNCFQQTFEGLTLPLACAQAFSSLPCFFCVCLGGGGGGGDILCASTQSKGRGGERREAE